MKYPPLELKNVWDTLIAQTAHHPEISDELFAAIQNAYESPRRHYHTFEHIKAMILLLEEHQEQIQNKEAMLFACFFHDVIYDSNSTQNEEQSAEYARIQMTLLGISKELIEVTVQLILLTKTHTLNTNASQDERIFVDTDIAILGSDLERYQTYAQEIRKEYGQFPDELYSMGRQKVLLHFLSQATLFHTFCFQERFEMQARQNIQWELNQLAK